MQIQPSALAKQLHVEFSKPQTTAEGLAALHQLGTLPPQQQVEVREELRALFKDEYVGVVERVRALAVPNIDVSMLAIGLGATPVTHTNPEVDVRAAEAASAKPKPAPPPQDVFTTMEDMLGKTNEDLAQLQDMLSVLKPDDAKKLKDAMAALSAVSDKAIGEAGRYQMAMAKALRLIDKEAAMNPTAAAEKKAKLYAEMEGYLRDVAAKHIDVSPDAMEREGLPRDTDPELVRRAIRGDAGAATQLQQLASVGLKTTRERELEGNVSRAGSMMGLIQSGMAIDDLLVLIMLLFLDDNDEQLRQKMREQEQARQSRNDLNAKRAKGSAALSTDEKKLEQLSAQLKRRLDEGPPQVQKAQEVKVDVKQSGGDVNVQVQVPQKGEQLSFAGMAPEVPNAPSPSEADQKAANTAAQEKWAAETAGLEGKITRLTADIEASKNALANMDYKLDEISQSSDKLQYQVTQLVDRRRAMMDMIGKILAVFSDMARASAQNMR